MKVKINNQDGRLVEVLFTFDDNSTITKKMELIPSGVTVEEEQEDGTIKEITTMIDPLDNLQDYFTDYVKAYLAGKEKENEDVGLLKGQVFNITLA